MAVFGTCKLNPLKKLSRATMAWPSKLLLELMHLHSHSAVACNATRTSQTIQPTKPPCPQLARHAADSALRHVEASVVSQSATYHIVSGKLLVACVGCNQATSCSSIASACY